MKLTQKKTMTAGTMVGLLTTRLMDAQIKRHVSRFTLLLLVFSLVALGGLLVSGSKFQTDKFTLADATTTTDNGKRLVAKPGFALKVKDQQRGTVVAYKTSVATKESADTVNCTCVLNAGNDGKGQSCKVSASSSSATCSGNCDKCVFRAPF